MSVNDLLKQYAFDGIPYKDISELLRKRHGLSFSSDAVRKRLRRMGVPSRKGPTVHSVQDVRRAIEDQIDKEPVTVGYRRMTEILRHKGFHVRRSTVMQLLREIDPDGVNHRYRRRIIRKVYRSLGPNHVWHVDGFSRRIMWLKCGPTNNDPKIVAYNFVLCIEEMKGCPVILQTDPGTENCIMGALQCTLRQHGDVFSARASYKITKSSLNQRIEAWWSLFRRHKSDWWINFFKDLEAFGEFRRGNPLDVWCLRYCFIPLIQTEMDRLQEEWNCHHITPSKHASCPNGRPTVLYFSPETTGGVNCIQRVDHEDVHWAFSQCHEGTISGSLEFDHIAGSLFSIRNWDATKSWQVSLARYFQMKDMLGNVEIQ